MISYRAAWVLPMTGSPIPDGVVTVHRGEIVAVAETANGAVEDLGHAAILPGLVNAHTHLEMSWMRGQVPPGSSMPAWAGALIALRRTVAHEPEQPIRDAVAEARASGTALVGDVTNTFATYEPLADSDLSAVLFRELLGFAAANPVALVAAAAQQIDELTPVAWLRPSIVPHAPYSVSPALFTAIAARAADRPISIHLGESAEELQFLRDGLGSWRMLLESLGVWNPAWVPAGCGPIDYMDRFGLVNNRLVAVHGVQFTEADLHRLAVAGATVVTCPRSNRWTGAGTPPIDRFYASGARIAIGTDSLASVQDLNVFSEMAEIHRLAPGVPAEAILASATRHGAEALGFESELGTIEPGKRAELVAVRIPPAVTDVAEYLVSGVEPGDIRWLDPA